MATNPRGMKVWEFLLLVVGLVVIAGVLVVAVNFTVLPRIVHRNTVVNTPDVQGMTPRGRQAGPRASRAWWWRRPASGPTLGARRA